MAVPDEIRQVPRPVNTTVYDARKDGPKRYFVRERLGCKYVKGRCPQPVYGKVIGYIHEGKFVPKDQNEKMQPEKPDSLAYGNAVFAYSVCDSLKQDLLKCFDISDALTILTIALLRVIRPRVPNSRLRSLYERSWISKFIPGIHLSENTVSKLLSALGMHGERRKNFFQHRLSSVKGLDHIAIDGTLKQDSSIVNDLSGFSYKSRLKGCRDISVLYAYDIEKMEPLCAQVFPGNCIDAGAYQTFIRENNIEKGVIIADKGFPPSKLSEVLKTRPELHYLTPVKRNNVNIDKQKILDFDGVLSGVKKGVLFSKRKSSSGRYYYAFKDLNLENREQLSYISNREQLDDFNCNNFRQKKEKFGLIVFESDQDMPAKTAYLCYQERWLLELMFKKYKSEEGFTDTRVQTDFSIWGSEFINFLSTVITSRMIKKANECSVLAKMTYGQMMEDLGQTWRKTNATGKPKTGDQYWVSCILSGMEILEKLGLSDPIEQPALKVSKPKGRPKVKPEFVGPKRPRGRPRKVLNN